MKACSKTVQYVLVYRPPSGSISIFLERFAQILEDMDQNSSECIIAGDFNLHVDQPSLPGVKRFLELLDNFGLIVRVNGPTHVAGHTLDLLITRTECKIVENIQVSDIISDHMAICFDINIELCEKQHIKHNIDH